MTDKILIDRELLENTIVLLDNYAKEHGGTHSARADELRAAMSAPQQEAVATVRDPYDTPGLDWHCQHPPRTGAKLYTHPAPSVPEGWQEHKPLAMLEALHDNELPTGEAILEKSVRFPNSPSADDRKDAKRQAITSQSSPKFLRSNMNAEAKRCPYCGEEVTHPLRTFCNSEHRQRFNNIKHSAATARERRRGLPLPSRKSDGR